MKKYLIISLSIILISILLFVWIVKNKTKFTDLDINKIEIYKVNLEKDFNILEDYQNALNIKEYIKIVEDTKVINEFKEALTKAKEGRFDYLGSLDEYTKSTPPLPTNPNYILKININQKEDLYLFYWLYDNQKQSYITYYKEKYNEKKLSKKNVVKLIITEE